MGVQLGELKTIGIEPPTVSVSASSYDADILILEQAAENQDISDMICLDRKQLQDLSVLIDRFLDR